jgi:hypothetical protein
MPGEFLLLASGGKMSKDVRTVLIFLGIGIAIYLIYQANANAGSVPFGAGATVAPNAPANWPLAGLTNSPKLTQN